MPNAHYIGRAQGGLGVTENIVTLCHNCHQQYDQTASRAALREEIKAYLQSRYPDWDERKLTYHKWETGTAFRVLWDEPDLPY